MSTIETLLFLSVLVFGSWLFLKARKYGKSLKEKHEKEAQERLGQDLSQVNINEYSIYRYEKDIFGRYSRKVSSYPEMIEKVIQSCIVYTGKGTHGHGPAKYTLSLDNENKALLYVTGTNDFDFTQENT